MINRLTEQPYQRKTSNGTRKEICNDREIGWIKVCLKCVFSVWHNFYEIKNCECLANVLSIKRWFGKESCWCKEALFIQSVKLSQARKTFWKCAYSFLKIPAMQQFWFIFQHESPFQNILKLIIDLNGIKNRHNREL